MRRAIVGICAAVIIIALGAYFGSELWAQFRTKNDVEAAFDSLRAAFSSATHGKVDLYSKTRSVNIADVVLQTADKATTIKIGQVVAVGTRGPTGGRVSAGRIELNDWEITTTIAAPNGPSVTYKAPSIVIEAFSGPSAFPTKVDMTSTIDITRACLEYVAATSANSITIPKLTARLTPAASSEAASAVGSIDYTYSDIVFRDIGNRRIKEIVADRVTVTAEMTPADVGSFAAAMAGLKVVDFNIDAPIAIFDPAKANDDNYIQMYGSTSVGPIEVRFSKGGGTRIEASTFDGIAIRPSKLSWSNLTAIVNAGSPKAGTAPSPEQIREMLDKVAGLYEGFRFSKLEMRNLVSEMPPNPAFKIGAIRLSGFENGRLAEFAMDNLDGTAQKSQPVHIGRFALKGLKFANFMRQASRLAGAGANPPPIETSLLMFSLLEGIEFKDIVGSYPASPQQKVRIDSFSLDWGKFVGPFPTTIRMSTKMTVPSSLADPSMGSVLSDAGMQNVTTSMDIGVTWDEPSQTLALSPAAIEVDKAFALGAKLSILNVTRNNFSIDLMQAMAAANAAQVGPIEITLRDTGAVKTALEQYAKTKSLSVDDARKEIIASVMEGSKAGAEKNPDIAGLAQAITQFIETPGSTLSIKVTPKQPLKASELLAATSADPNAAFSMFSIEAKTTH